MCVTFKSIFDTQYSERILFKFLQRKYIPALFCFRSLRSCKHCGLLKRRYQFTFDLGVYDIWKCQSL